LKNKAIVDEAEKLLKDFKPVTYDVSTHIKAIETFEAKAVRTPVLTMGVFLNITNRSGCFGQRNGAED